MNDFEPVTVILEGWRTNPDGSRVITQRAVPLVEFAKMFRAGLFDGVYYIGPSQMKGTDR